MKPAFENTALLLFARTPRDEARHKHLLGAGKKSRTEKIFQKLNWHARQLGRESGLPFFVIDSGAQQGQTFGERFYGALAGVYARGFTRVITIGNDCAQLRAADIIQAATLLQNKQAVFGPAQDGGVYLLGLHRDLLAQPGAFLNINWQTATVLAELQNWAQKANSAVLPQTYADLDNPTDLYRALQAHRLPAAILHLIRFFLKPLTYAGSHTYYSVLYSFSRSISFRGPPALR